MAEYTPNNWVVIKMKGDDPHYRVLAGWTGGFLDGSTWRMNSGITLVDDADEDWLFYGSSGSVYRCNKGSYELRMNIAQVWAQLQELHGDKVEMMPEDTDWLNMDWVINLKNFQKGNKNDRLSMQKCSDDPNAFPDVTRVEVIDENGRSYVKYNCNKVKICLQDDGHTLKLFLDKENRTAFKELTLNRGSKLLKPAKSDCDRPLVGLHEIRHVWLQQSNEDQDE